MTSNNNIILLSEIYDMRAEKEKELQFYEEKLQELQNKLFFVRKEIQLTNFIIDMIEKEKVIDLQEYIDRRNELPKL